MCEICDEDHDGTPDLMVVVVGGKQLDEASFTKDVIAWVQEFGPRLGVSGKVVTRIHHVPAPGVVQVLVVDRNLSMGTVPDDALLLTAAAVAVA